MTYSLKQWIDLFKKHKHEAICLDIETTGMNGDISLVGLYTPKDGEIIHTYFLKDINLNQENLKQAFKGGKFLITYSGYLLDIPKIDEEFPGVIPKNIPIFDIYLFAKKLGINTNLKALENTLGIDRLDDYTKKRHIAVKMWNRYKKYNDKKALATLIEYNKQDTINLYFLAEKLIKMLEEKEEKAKSSLSKLPRI
jgi:uncharacterized protein YprB with RNaseH-like and TPR domain